LKQISTEQLVRAYRARKIAVMIAALVMATFATGAIVYRPLLKGSWIIGYLASLGFTKGIVISILSAIFILGGLLIAYGNSCPFCKFSMLKGKKTKGPGLYGYCPSCKTDFRPGYFAGIEKEFRETGRTKSRF
jgi:hypothetical protein